MVPFQQVEGLPDVQDEGYLQLPAEPIQQPHAEYPTSACPTEAVAESNPIPLCIEIEPGMISQTGDLHVYPRESDIDIVMDTLFNVPFSFPIPPDKDHIPTKSDDSGQDCSHDDVSASFFADEFELQRESIPQSWPFNFEAMLRLIKNSTISSAGCVSTLSGPSFQKRISLMQGFMKNAVKFKNSNSKLATQYYESLEHKCSKEGLSTFKFNVLGKYPYDRLMWLPTTNRSSLSLCMLSCILKVLRSRNLSMNDLKLPEDDNNDSVNDEPTYAEKHAQWIFHEAIERLKVLKDHPQKSALLMAGIAFLKVLSIGPSKGTYEFLPFLFHFCKRSFPLVFQPATSKLYSLMSCPSFEKKDDLDVDDDFDSLPCHFSPDEVPSLSHALKAKNDDVEVSTCKVNKSLVSKGIKEELEDAVVSNMTKYEIDLPMRYIFLYSLLQSLGGTLTRRSDITELAVSYDIGMDDDDVGMFLKTFTSFANLFYVPSLSDVVLLDIEKFVDYLDKLYASEKSSSGCISEAAIDSLAEQEELDPDTFKEVLQGFHFAVHVAQSRVKNPNITIDGDYFYYIPSMRCSDTEIIDHYPHSLYFKTNLRFMPGSLQARLIHHVQKIFDFFLIPTPHINATTIGVRFQEICIEVTIIDHADAMELRPQAYHSPDNYSKAYSLLMQTCVAAMNDAKNAIDGLQYDFAFKCANPESNQYHLLDDNNHCEGCDISDSATFKDYWRKAQIDMDISKHTEKDESNQSMPNYDLEKLQEELRERDALIAKLMQQKLQMQEKKTKESSSTGVQYEYIEPPIGNLLEHLGDDIKIAGKELFVIEGDKPQMLSWKKFGLKISVEKNSLSAWETSEVTVVALVGGKFKFPKNTVLVSAVYAVTVSKRLLKPLKLEMEHCVDLTGQPGLSKYLKFAIAPVSTPSLPYQFRIIEGQEFRSDSQYGCITYGGDLTLACILGLMGHQGGGGGGGGGEQQEEQSEGQEEEEEEADDSAVAAAQVQQSQDCKDYPQDELQKESIGAIFEFMTYAGLIYYEEKNALEDLVTFVAAKNLSALIQFIGEKHSQAEVGQNVFFSFKKSEKIIELKFDAPQDEPFTGWSVRPHMTPCRLRRLDIDNYGGEGHSLPPSCLVSVCGSLGAEPTLHYAVPLVGVADSVTLNIHRSLRTPPSSTSPSPSSSPPAVHVASTTEEACMSATIDVDKMKKVINDVLITHDAKLTSLKESLPDLAYQLYSARLITEEIRANPSMDKFISEFKASLEFMSEVCEIQEHCQMFLKAFIAISGSYDKAAKFLKKKWIEAIKSEVGIDYNIEINT